MYNHYITEFRRASAGVTVCRNVVSLKLRPVPFLSSTIQGVFTGQVTEGSKVLRQSRLSLKMRFVILSRSSLECARRLELHYTASLVVGSAYKHHGVETLDKSFIVLSAESTAALSSYSKLVTYTLAFHSSSTKAKRRWSSRYHRIERTKLTESW